MRFNRGGLRAGRNGSSASQGWQRFLGEKREAMAKNYVPRTIQRAVEFPQRQLKDLLSWTVCKADENRKEEPEPDARNAKTGNPTRPSVRFSDEQVENQSEEDWVDGVAFKSGCASACFKPRTSPYSMYSSNNFNPNPYSTVCGCSSPCSCFSPCYFSPNAVCNCICPSWRKRRKIVRITHSYILNMLQNRNPCVKTERGWTRCGFRDTMWHWFLHTYQILYAPCPAAIRPNPQCLPQCNQRVVRRGSSIVWGIDGQATVFSSCSPIGRGSPGISMQRGMTPGGYVGGSRGRNGVSYCGRRSLPNDCVQQSECEQQQQLLTPYQKQMMARQLGCPAAPPPYHARVQLPISIQETPHNTNTSMFSLWKSLGSSAPTFSPSASGKPTGRGGESGDFMLRIDSTGKGYGGPNWLEYDPSVIAPATEGPSPTATSDMAPVPVIAIGEKVDDNPTNVPRSVRRIPIKSNETVTIFRRKQRNVRGATPYEFRAVRLDDYNS